MDASHSNNSDRNRLHQADHNSTTMTSHTSGILRWTSSIRDSMINDPGRQFFEDQVQSQGFLFLDEYLDNIWAAAKQDSFVDLVKTPGRRRVSPQKARQAVATHLVLPDETDVFQSHPLKTSPPPLESIAEHGDHTIDLSPEIRRSHSAIIEETEDFKEDFIESLPPDPPAPPAFVDMSVPLREEASEAGIPRNPSLPNFPSLAAPSPLRKSTWNPRESSLEPTQAATPGTGLTGHHTSWLAKVREAKAIEVTNKRASVAPAGLIAHSGGVKRKSGEIPGKLPHGDEHEERKVKIPKTSSPDVTETVHFESRPATTSTFQPQATEVHVEKSADSAPFLQADSEADLMAPMRKAIESLRARTGKSVAGNLVEASTHERFGVEAEVAASKADVLPRPNPLYPTSTRDTVASDAIIHATTPPMSGQQVAEPNIVAASHEAGKRLSLSDLVPKHEQSNAAKLTSTNETSISTTPPDSPPATKKTPFFVPGGPVFNKPPPVFVPPPATVPKSTPPADSDVLKGHKSEFPGYALGAPFGIGLHPTKLSKSPPLALLSGQSTQSSSFSDNVFESQNNIPAWVPDSQDTQVTSQESLPVLEKREHPVDLDDDDSWRLDDKFAATNQMWTPFAGITAVEDSMTWSTVPSQSQMGGKSPRQDPTEAAATRSQQSQDVVNELDEDMDVDDDIKSDTMDAGKPTANHDATKSQLSVASSSGESSQPVGFFGQATKLVSSMLGVSKKTKTEPPKSIQLAAAVAKKQQEEQDRKAARLKDMEARRQAVLQKKVEEERSKADEEEKKAKDSAERRKKEREENTGKRPLVKADSKHLEEDNKKKKVTVEVPKAKPPSKEKKEAPPTRIRKPSQTTNVRAVAITKQQSTTSLNQTTGSKAVPTEKPAVKAPPAPASIKGKGKAPVGSEDAPSKKAMQSQTTTHKHAQRPDAEPPVTSEMIELPEPNSEYSDSEDENRARKFDAPVWTQSPELRAALESQSRVNPDDIFGPVRPLRMEDIFRNRTSRFRARTSSANWSGPDGLKQEEEREYARRMGFR
ncbi:hypothetical protein BJY52DRAFT_1168607 [Lactarius psammicola]|nr:hypothetical protein BJY52DRAFT_1168607 [Lactarius psammicola]